MNEIEFASHAQNLFGFFNKNPNEKTLAFWFAELRSIPEHVMHQAVIDACNNERYMPTLAEFKRIAAKRKPASERQDGPPPDPDLTSEELAYNAKIFPLMSKFMAMIPSVSRPKQCELFALMMPEIYGAAVTEGVVDKIDWSEYDGCFDFKVPAAWIARGAKF